MKNGTIAVLGGDRNSRNADKLRRLGLTVFEMPTVSFEPLDLPNSKLVELANPDTFDLVIFADERAVEFLGDRFAESAIDPIGFDHTTVVALGEPVADRLRFLLIHADVIPARLTSETVLNTISAYLGGADALNEMSVLVVASISASWIPLNELRDSGCIVETVYTSRMSIDDQRALNRMKALAIGGGIDQVFFSSTLDVFDSRVLKELGFDLFSRGATAICNDGLSQAALEETGVRSRIMRVLS
ncbi:MAG: hypothetical protein DWQ47_03790 [Acidobacteria bacterium]|nr:MAG: hypothetical protein DWQ32_07340 [Acidobacteriota bacterium]REK01517.1 MAG: hypothetical protein DWQ38_03775 [Acidobacteriota bacterium]REK14473.1 MAG: hypothetical protein DWQ43_13030 [Acidobacteriota bacterium]REK45188.1 MAG: hypothetical protein DWQ47_03790 [Acidobacteriota bacterium]